MGGVRTPWGLWSVRQRHETSFKVILGPQPQALRVSRRSQRFPIPVLVQRSVPALRALRNDLPCVELDEHSRVGLEVLDGHGQPEVVEDEELQLEVVELSERKTTDLGKI